MAAEISGPRLCWFKVYPKAIAHKTNLPGECTLGMEFSSRPLGRCPNPPLVESHHLVKIKKGEIWCFLKMASLASVASMALDKKKEECDFVKNKRMRIRPLGR